MQLKAMLRHNEFFYALERAGVITNAALVDRVVIDARRGRFVTVHVELAADKGLLDVAARLGGVKITGPGPEPGGPEEEGPG